MTALDLSALEALEREATPRPWAADAHRDAYILADGPPGTVHAMTNVVARVTLTRDVPLIIALRNSFPALAAELRAAREVVAVAQRIREHRDARNSRVRAMQDLANEARRTGKSLQHRVEAVERQHPVVWDLGDEVENLCDALKATDAAVSGARSSLKDPP